MTMKQGQMGGSRHGYKRDRLVCAQIHSLRVFRLTLVKAVEACKPGNLTRTTQMGMSVERKENAQMHRAHSLVEYTVKLPE